MGCGSSKASTALTPRGQAPITTPRDPAAIKQKNAEINNNVSGSKTSVRSIRALRAAKSSSAQSRDSGVEEMSGGGSGNASPQPSPKALSADASKTRARQKLLRIDGTQHSSSVGSVRSIDQEAVKEITDAFNKSSVRSDEDENLTLPPAIPPIKSKSAGTHSNNSDDSAVGMDDEMDIPLADDSVPSKEPASLEVSMRPKTRAGNLAFDLTFDTMMPDTSNKKKVQLDKLERRKSKRKKKKTLKEIQSDLAVAEERRKELEEQKAQKAIKTRVTCSITAIEQFQADPDTPRNEQDPFKDPSPEEIINGTVDFYDVDAPKTKTPLKHSPQLPHKPVVAVVDDDDRLESAPLAAQSDGEEW